MSDHSCIYLLPRLGNKEAKTEAKATAAAESEAKAKARAEAKANAEVEARVNAGAGAKTQDLPEEDGTKATTADATSTPAAPTKR